MWHRKLWRKIVPQVRNGTSLKQMHVFQIHAVFGLEKRAEFQKYDFCAMEVLLE